MIAPALRQAAALAVAAALLSGCLITDRLDIEPAESTKGSEVRQILTEAGQFLSAFTQYLFITNGLTIRGSSGSLASDVLTSGLLAPTISSIEDDAFYTNPSVEDCRTRVQTEGAIVVAQAVEELKRTCNNPPDPDCLNQYQNSYNLTGLLGGRQLAEFCALKKTGDIIHFGDRISL